MKQRLYITVILLISIICGLSHVSAQEKLKITDLDKAFKFIEKNKAYDKVTDVIEYESVDEAAYDKVFKGAAVMNGMVKQLNFGLDEIAKGPQDITQAVAKMISSGFVLKTNFSVNDLSSALKTVDNYEALKGNYGDLDTKVQFYFTTIAFTKDLVTNGPNKVTEMLNSAKSLNPTKDFTGFSARKIPSVTSALTTSISNLGSAGTEIGKMAEKLTGLGF